MVRCWVDGIRYNLVVVGGFLLLNCIVNLVSSDYGDHDANYGDDELDRSLDGQQSGSGNGEDGESPSTVAYPKYSTTRSGDFHPFADYSAIVAVVGCTTFLSIVIIGAIVAVLVRRKRRSRPFKNDGKASKEKNVYEVQRPERRLQLLPGEERYTSLSNVNANQPSSPDANGSPPIYDEIKLS